MDSREISECFASEQNKKAVTRLKYFNTHVNFVYYIFDKNVF